MLKNSLPLEENCSRLKYHEYAKVIGQRKSFLEARGGYMPAIRASIVTSDEFDDSETAQEIGHIRAYLLQLGRIKFDAVNLW